MLGSGNSAKREREKSSGERGNVALQFEGSNPGFLLIGMAGPKQDGTSINLLLGRRSGNRSRGPQFDSFISRQTKQKKSLRCSALALKSTNTIPTQFSIERGARPC